MPDSGQFIQQQNMQIRRLKDAPIAGAIKKANPE
jgi:hypothetical protein